MRVTFPNSNRILPRLYQGERPPPGETMPMHGFSRIVLCALEYQPPAEAFPGVALYRCPFDDSYKVPLTNAEVREIKDTASRVARDLRLGERVYVSCYQGLNRSGLVTALVVRELLGCSGREAKAWVQLRRAKALSNPLFAAYLDELTPPGRMRIYQRTA